MAMTTVSRIVRISDINVDIPPNKVKDELERILSKDFREFDVSVVKPKDKNTRLAFLTFQSIREAESVVRLHKKLILFGDSVRVAIDHSGVIRRKPPRSPEPPGTSSMSDLLKQAESLISKYRNSDERISARDRRADDDHHMVSKRKSPSPDYLQINPESETRMPPSQTLFIGKLDSSVRKKDLEKVLERFGVIENIMIYNSNNKNVYAFVRFFNLFMARKALKSMKDKKLLHLECLFGYGLTATSNILWVGGIGPWVDIIILKKKFEEFGEVKNIEWPSNKNFAYVEFAVVGSAKRAMEKLRGTILGKKRIWVDFSNRYQMTSDLNYREIYLGGDSDSDDEIVTLQPDQHLPLQYEKFTDKDVDVYFDNVYRERPKSYTNMDQSGSMKMERSRSRNRLVHKDDRRIERLEYGSFSRSPKHDEYSRKHSSSQRNDFDWRDERYKDNLYDSVDGELSSSRNDELDLRYTIKNDLYFDRTNPDKYRPDDASGSRKRKLYERLGSPVYKKHRSRDRSDRAFYKYPGDSFSSRRSPESSRRGYDNSYDLKRSPSWKSPVSSFSRPKFDESNRLSMNSSEYTQAMFNSSIMYDNSLKFDREDIKTDLHIPHGNWYDRNVESKNSLSFGNAIHSGGHSPTTRPLYKAPIPHAVQMSSVYGDSINSRSLEQELVRKYPTVWNGGIVFKNKCYWTCMSLISGSIPLVNSLLNDSLPVELNLLKITQRLRLDMPEKLVELERRVDLAGRNGSSILLAIQHNKLDHQASVYEYQPLAKLNSFLKETQFAAVVLLPVENSISMGKGLLHIFPKCQFSVNFLQREAPELVRHFQEGESLLMIVMKDVMG